MEAIQAGLSDEHMKVMNLSHDWLSTFLPHVMAKINRFKFGVRVDSYITPLFLLYYAITHHSLSNTSV